MWSPRFERWHPPVPTIDASVLLPKLPCHHPIRFTASRSRFAWAVSIVWSCAGLAFDGVRGDAGDVHGRRARTVASTRVCLASQAAPSSASGARFAWTGSYLWSFAGLERGGARGDAGGVHGHHARTLACACMRRSSLHSPSHARHTHPQMHALMHRFPLLVGTLRCSCASLADSSYHANATFRQRPKASTASKQAYQVA